MTITYGESLVAKDPPAVEEENGYIEAAAEQAADVANSHTRDSLNEDSSDDGRNNDDDSDDENDNSWHAQKIRHWKKNDFAVGLVNVTWNDDRGCGGNGLPSSDRNHNVPASAYLCGCAGRLGNLVILAQTTEEIEEDVTTVDGNNAGRRKQKRPKLLWVVGPYWTVNLGVTFPLILGISFWTLWTRVVDSHIAVIITWSICTLLLVFALLMVACRDPGVLYRHKSLPDGAEDWRWNDQARTYRPPKARFDPECQVVVDGFDHV